MTEYDFLFRSLFKSSAIYRQVVEAIATKSKGLTLKEIKESLGNIGDGGGLSIVLDNLCKCDFIRRYYAFGKKERGAVYQLTDMFTLFHTKFIRRDEGLDQHFWSNIKDVINSFLIANSESITCVEVPLLFESHLDKVFTFLVGVESSSQRDNLISRGEEDVDRKLDLNKRSLYDFNRHKLNYIIENDGSKEELKSKVKDIYLDILKK